MSVCKAPSCKRHVIPRWFRTLPPAAPCRKFGGKKWRTPYSRAALRHRDYSCRCGRRYAGRNYSYRTEEAYVQWIRRFIYFSAKRHPLELGAAEVTAFLNHLASERDVAAATQNQALSALLFLYKVVLEQPLPWLDALDRAKRPARLPTVLTQAEVRRLLDAMRGTRWLMASLLYGAGLRLTECLKLRVKDIDFGYRQILVRDAKGAKDRVTMLPRSTVEPLKRQLAVAKAMHEADAAAGVGGWSCRTRWRASIRARLSSGRGSSCFRRPSCLPIRAPA